MPLFTSHSPRTFLTAPGCLSFLFVMAAAITAVTSSEAGPIEAVDPAPDRPADFYVDVYPVLEAKCLACHSRTKQESDLILEDVAGILKGGASGPAVIPNQPDQSLLFKLCARMEDPVMPPLPNRVGATALTPHELGRLRRWITEGAQPGKMNPSAAAIGWQALPSTMTASFALACGPQDRFVALGRANMLAVCDLVTGKEVPRLGDPLIRSVKTPSQLPLYDREVAHFDVVSSLAFSPDGDLIASGSYREIKIWQRQRNPIAVRIDAGAQVSAPSMNPGSRLLTARADGGVVLWDLEQGSEVSSVGPIQGLEQATILGNGPRAIVVKQSGELSLFDLAEKRELLAWTAGQPVTVLATSTSGDVLYTGHADGSIRRWDLPAQLPKEMGEPAGATAATGSPVQRLAVSADGKSVVSGFAHGKVGLLSADLTSTKDVQSPAGSSILALAPDGSLAVSTGETRRTAEIRRGLKSPELVLPSVPVLTNRVRQMEDDRTVAQMQKGQAEEALKTAQKEADERTAGLTAAEKAQTTANEALPKAQAALDEGEAALKKAQDELAAKPDDEALKKAVTDAEGEAKKPREALTAARDALTTAERNVRFADTSAQAARAELGLRRTNLESRSTRLEEIDRSRGDARTASRQSEVQIISAAISADSRLIATGHSDSLVHLWAAEDGRWLESFSGHGSSVDWLTFAADNSLVSASKDGVVISWNLEPQWKLAAVLGTKPENRLDVSSSPLTDRVLALAFSPDGRLLASGGGEPSRGGEVLLWDVGSMTVQREPRELHSDTVNSLAFSRDGRILATGSADKFVRLTEVESGRLVRTLEGHTGHVLGVEWSADGGTLSSGGADGALKVWNTETGEQRKSIAATPGQVTAVAGVGLIDQLVIANSKGQCQLLERSSGKVIRTYTGATGYLYQAAVSSDGESLMAAGEDGVLRVWKVADGKLAREFKP